MSQYTYQIFGNYATKQEVLVGFSGSYDMWIFCHITPYVWKVILLSELINNKEFYLLRGVELSQGFDFPSRHQILHLQLK